MSSGTTAAPSLVGADPGRIPVLDIRPYLAAIHVCFAPFPAARGAMTESRPRVCAREGGSEGRAEGCQRPLREGPFRKPEGPAARHSQPATPPDRTAVASGAPRHPGSARPAPALPDATGPEPRIAAAGAPARSRRAARHRLFPHAFGAGGRRGARESARRRRPWRDRAQRRGAPRPAGAQAAA